jgi:hypothetical protein
MIIQIFNWLIQYSILLKQYPLYHIELTRYDGCTIKWLCPSDGQNNWAEIFPYL